MNCTEICARTAVLALCISFSNVYAEPPHVSTMTEKGLSTHIHESEVQEGMTVPEGMEIADHEPSYWEKIEWGVIADGVLHGNTGGSCWKDEADAVYSFDVEALFPCSENGAAYFLLEAGGGEGVDGRIATFSGFNDHSTSKEDIELSELWYEQKWFDGHLRGRAGKIDLTTDFDTNSYANCEHEQFLSGGFINNLAAEIPENSFGGMLWYEPTEKIAVGAGYQSNNEWDDVFHDGFGMLELDWKPVFFEHPGNYRIYGWASAHKEVQDEENGEIIVNPYTNYGWGFSLDQEITSHFGLWMRFGSQRNKEFNAFKSHTTLGAQFMNFGSRTEDAVGIAYGITELADAYAESLENHGEEHHVEIYYRAKIHKFISLTPNIQWLKNPEGDADRGGVTVLGLRGTFMM